ncbi:MAG: flavin reductase family protein [Phycisphaerales bacterium]|nr:flavin reductase family protein [Phycisphaerales bacterium]
MPDFDPTTLDIARRYKLLIGTIVPRPIALVSTVSTQGRTNLAPFSFFAGVGSNPMTLLFCPATNADGTDKDTLRNAAPTSEGGVGQFVVNVATEHYAAKVAAAAEELPFGESEFDLVGLTPETATKVRPPRVKESPVCFECETVQVIRTNAGAPSSGNIVLGRVVWARVHDDVVDGRLRIAPSQLKAIGRMAGLTYCTTRERFDLPWGRAALEIECPFK